MGHLVAGMALVLVGGILTAYGHGGIGPEVMIGAGATLLPTAPSGLLRSKTTGSLINDTIAAMAAGSAAAGHPIAVQMPAPAPAPAPAAPAPVIGAAPVAPAPTTQTPGGVT